MARRPLTPIPITAVERVTGACDRLPHPDVTLGKCFT